MNKVRIVCFDPRRDVAPQRLHNNAPQRLHNNAPQRLHNNAPQRLYNNAPQRLYDNNALILATITCANFNFDSIVQPAI